MHPTEKVPPLRFERGDPIYEATVESLQHEYLRAEDAFQEFFGHVRLMGQRSPSNWEAFRTYNAYARFIFHMYEFLLGAAKWQSKNTKTVFSAGDAEALIARHIGILIANRRRAAGAAAEFDGSLKDAPAEFASAFRKYRNLALGHADPLRSRTSMSDFYTRYHHLLYMALEDARWLWGVRDGEFPDLGEITAFVESFR